MASRGEVYHALNTERDYQGTKWDDAEHQHTPEEWIVYMEDYLREAKQILSRGHIKEVRPRAMHTIRKITAMGVCCMEQNGAPVREGHRESEEV